jgi:hypothetical protein
MKRYLALIFGLMLAGVATSLAHDPYEITAVVYIQSNRIELFVEMEFPTGMTLAGQKPSREATISSQFEVALPQLEKLAGAFLEITAGNNAVLPLRTNVQLGVEDHIQCKVEFAPTDYRPLRFVPRGLRNVADSPYGISLTVLDMVKQKVLGQTTLFADSPAADFPATDANPNPLAGPTLALAKKDEPQAFAATTNVPLETAKATKPHKSRLLMVVAFAGVAVLLVAWRWSQTRSSG